MHIDALGKVLNVFLQESQMLRANGTKISTISGFVEAEDRKKLTGD